jgi:hypothetical protein
MNSLLVAQRRQGCQIFLGKTNQIGKKYTKMDTKILNSYKIFKNGNYIK